MVMQTSCKKDMEHMDLLQAFEIIVDKAKNSSLGEKFYEDTDSYLGFVSDKLDISKRASALLDEWTCSSVKLIKWESLASHLLSL